MLKPLSQWLASLPRLIKISLLMESPAALPGSRNALLLTVLAYFLVGYVALGDKYPVPVILAQVGLEIAILGSISFLFLKLKGKLQRLLQTLYALIGVNLVISVLSLTVLTLIQPDGELQPDSWQLKLQLAILLWNLAAVSLIFQRAFEIRTLLAAFTAFNYLLLYEFLLIKLFG